MDRAELLERLQQKYRDWEVFLAQVGPQRMEQPGVNGEWSMKDMVAHLNGWNRRLLADLQAAARGEPEPPPPWGAQLQTEDAINAWIYEDSRSRPLREVLNETRQALSELLRIVKGLPDDTHIELRERDFYLVWLNGRPFEVSEFFDHFRDDHEADVRRWLEKQRPGGQSS